MKKRTRQTMNRFRMRAIAFVVIFAMALSAAASMPMDVFAATSGKCGDNLTWSLDEGTGTLTISGSGKMTDYDYNNAFSINGIVAFIQVKHTISPTGFFLIIPPCYPAFYSMSITIIVNIRITT